MAARTRRKAAVGDAALKRSGCVDGGLWGRKRRAFADCCGSRSPGVYAHRYACDVCLHRGSDANAHAHGNAYTCTYSHAYPNAHVNADAHTSSDSYAHSFVGAYSYTYTSAYANARSYADLLGFVRW